MALTFGPFSFGRAPAVVTATPIMEPPRAGTATPYEEIGAVGTTYFGGFLDSNEYNPDLAGQSAIKTYTKMKADGMVRGILRALVLPLLATTVHMEPASEDEQDINIAQVVEKALLNMEGQAWEDFERQALMGAFTYGHSVFEPVYVKPDGDPNMVDVMDDGHEYLVPFKIAPRLQMSIYRWHIDRFGELQGIQQQTFVGTMDPSVNILPGDTSGAFAYGQSGSYHYIDIPIDRLLVFSFDREGANYLGESVLRSAYQPWYYKNSIRRTQGISFERHGVGTPYAVVKQGIASSEKSALVQALASYRSHEKSYLLVSEAQLAKGSDIGMPPIGILQMPTLGSAASAMDKAIQYCDREMAINVLADFLSLGSGLGGNANVMSRDKTSYFFLAEQGFGMAFTDGMKRLIRQIVDINFPNVKRYPTMTLLGLEAKDIDRYGRSLAALYTVDAITPDAESENQIRELFGLPALPEDADGNPVRPKPPEPVATPAAVPPPAAEGVSPSDSGGGDYSEGWTWRAYADPDPAAEALRKKLAKQIADNAAQLQDDDEYDEDDFTADSHSQILTAILAGLALGNGGGGSGDRGSISRANRTWAQSTAEQQKAYLDGFAQDVSSGNMTPAAIAQRADLYGGTVWSGYQRGTVAAMPPRSRILWHAEGDATTCELCAERDGEEYTEDTLPGYPGEGGFGDLCEGAANCRCWLELISEHDMSEKPKLSIRNVERDSEGRITRITEEVA